MQLPRIAGTQYIFSGLLSFPFLVVCPMGVAAFPLPEHFFFLFAETTALDQ